MLVSVIQAVNQEPGLMHVRWELEFPPNMVVHEQSLSALAD